MLVSGGEDTCGPPDPCEVAKELGAVVLAGVITLLLRCRRA